MGRGRFRTRGGGGGGKGRVHVKTPTLFPGESPRCFSIQTVNFAHVFYVASRRRHLSVFLWLVVVFLSFRQLRCRGKCGPPSPKRFRRKRKKKNRTELRPRDGRVEHVRVHNFRVYLSKKPTWAFIYLDFCSLKMTKIRFSAFK